MNVHQIAPYVFSTDYAKLAELAKIASVICVIEADGCHDVAKTVYCIDEDVEQWLISTRGTCYLWALDIPSLIRKCTAANVRFIAPPAATAS